ncbi:hypothetical protein RSAG8_12360, partial [Rhizoctonia solani AG-8 WAC10335]
MATNKVLGFWDSNEFPSKSFIIDYLRDRKWLHLLN